MKNGSGTAGAVFVFRDAGVTGVRGSARAAVRVQLVFADFAAEGIAVNPQNLRGAAPVAFGVFEDVLDKALFEFPDGLLEQDAVLHHLADEPFQLVLHVITLRTEFVRSALLQNPV
jgi:hypothetical protein